MSALMDWAVPAFLVAVAAVFVINGYRRYRWDLHWDAQEKGSTIPEALLFYDARDLEKFVNIAKKFHIGKKTALDYYIGMLRRSDIFFAIALSLFTAFLWYHFLVTPEPWPWLVWLISARVAAWCWLVLQWLAIPGICFAILYGVADVAEDLRLASILWHAGKPGGGGGGPPSGRSAPAKTDIENEARVDRADASAANALTRIKIAALAASGIGGAVFFLLNKTRQGIVLFEKWRRGSGGDSSSGTGKTGELVLNR